MVLLGLTIGVGPLWQCMSRLMVLFLVTGTGGMTWTPRILDVGRSNAVEWLLISILAMARCWLRLSATLASVLAVCR